MAVCPQCNRQFDTPAGLSGHRSGKSSGLFNPCHYTEEEIVANKEATKIIKRDKMRLKRGSVPLEVYLANREPADPEVKRRKQQEASLRWRLAHPEKYKASIRANNVKRWKQTRSQNLKRKARVRENIARNARRAAMRTPDVPLIHPLLAEAAKLVPNNSTLTTLYDPLHEDLRSEAILALLEGRDPLAAIISYRAIEKAWGRVTMELLYE